MDQLSNKENVFASFLMVNVWQYESASHVVSDGRELNHYIHTTGMFKSNTKYNIKKVASDKNIFVK